MASLARIPLRSLARYEDDKPIPSDKLARIAQALGTTTDYLVGLTEDPEPPDPFRPRGCGAVVELIAA